MADQQPADLSPAQTIPTPADESLEQHGKASYYYWHSREPAPRVMPAMIDAAPASAAEPVINVKSIQTFAWTDDGAHVKVYVPFPGAKALPADAIACSFERDTVQLTVRTDGSRHVLRLSPLFSTISPDECRWRATDQRITLTLSKAGGKQPGGRWLELCRRGA